MWSTPLDSEVGLMLNMLVIRPLGAIEVEKWHILPVDSISKSILDVTNSWDLEWEQRRALDHWSLVFLFAHLNRVTLVIDLDQVVVAQEFTVESTDYHNFVWRQLGHAGTLSGSNWLALERGGGQIDLFPWVGEVG